MKDYWNSNIEALKQTDEALYHKVINYSSEEDIGEIVPTNTNFPTFRFREPGKSYTYTYNTDDPIKQVEATLPILRNQENLSQTICIFTGMGLGYAQIVALKKRTDVFRLIILEPSFDMFCIALKYVDLHSLILSDKVFIFAGDIDWNKFFDICSKKNIETDFLFSDYLALFDWKPELYNNTKQMARTFAERAIAGLGVMTRFGEQLFKNRVINLKLLRESTAVDVLKGAFKNRPAILVSAGPSLGQSFESLRKAVGRCIIIALDSAVVPLLNNGIKPDFVTTLDYQDINSEKLSPDIIKNQDFYLVANITSSHLTPKRLELKHLFFSFQENDAQTWIMEGMDAKYKMPPVGSVAMLSLSFAQMIEADPIIFVGHDFALTSTEIDHVQGAVLAGGYYFTLDSLTIKGIDGKPVATNNTFLEFKINFEQILKNYKRTYINSTAAGAHIEGSSVQSLESVIETYLNLPFSTEDIVNSCLNSSSKNIISKFIYNAKHVIADAKKVLNQVNKILNETAKVSNILQSKSHKLSRVNNFSELPSSIQASKQKIKKLYSKYKPFLQMEELAAKRIMEANSANIVESESAKSNYIGSVEKENANVVLHMNAHKYGLEEFIKLVGELVIFLETENKYLKTMVLNTITENQLIEFAEFYLNNDAFIRSKNILNKFIEMFPNAYLIGRAKVLMGLAAAHCLDFDAAFKLWEDAEKREPKLKDEIIEHRKKLARYWLSWGFGGEPGQGYPIIIKRLQRAYILWDNYEFFRNLKDVFWNECIAYIIKSIENSKFEESEQCLSLSAAVQKETPEWYYCMARVFFNKKELSNTFTCIDLAKEKWDECIHSIGLRWVAKDEVNIKAIQEATLFKDMCQTLKYGTEYQYYDIAKKLYDKEQSQELNIFLNNSIQKYPYNSNLLALSARINIESGNYDKGIEELIKAVELDPSEAVLWEELGDTLFLQQDYASAAIAYEKCFLAIPDRIDVLRKLGDCYLNSNQFEAAKAAYLAVIEKEPSHDIATHNLQLIENVLK